MVDFFRTNESVLIVTERHGIVKAVSTRLPAERQAMTSVLTYAFDEETARFASRNVFYLVLGCGLAMIYRREMASQKNRMIYDSDGLRSRSKKATSSRVKRKSQRGAEGDRAQHPAAMKPLKASGDVKNGRRPVPWAVGQPTC
ncbi:hypothetical protein GWI33_018653 [Rhynchophorus ferrugineus]|uniref:Uncharacterized protein n=1 Tax=Rhynchophorus ferrugineus TaxID=354439 RepID=A0A834HXF1_RHYFE|nr:hypothetical protein GWI33_018653 [Rhynchophorus ferrugineus]